jgi:hypothetical protein
MFARFARTSGLPTKWRMTMHNVFAEILFALDKFFANPKKVFPPVATGGCPAGR